MEEKKLRKKEYTLSIIECGDIKTVSLNDFKKDVITFGRDKNNDIVLDSPIVSSKHGYFKIDDNSISIYDNKSKNGLFINNILLFDGCVIGYNDTIKIDNPLDPLMQGVLMVLSTENDSDKWKTFNLSKKD